MPIFAIIKVLTMDNIISLPTVQAYNDHWGVPTRHPYVNVLDGSQIDHPIPNCLKNMGMYVVFLKDVMCADYLKYGRQTYDYQENTLVFVAPGQVFGHPQDGSTYRAKGWVLYFSPELLRGTSLGRRMKDYTFFSYESYEALHLSEQERHVVIDCLQNIAGELQHAIDKHSRTLIVSNIELLLNYSTRFYERQFITRNNVNRDVLAILNKAYIPVRDQNAEAVQRERQERAKVDVNKLQASRMQAAAQAGQQDKQKPMPVHVEKKVGRNDPCPCGSGKKYKQCHGKGI